MTLRGSCFPRYVGTGNLHIAIYDHSHMLMHVATARSDGESGELNAYQRQFLRLNMTEIFGEPRPSEDEWRNAKLHGGKHAAVAAATGK